MLIEYFETKFIRQGDANINIVAYSVNVRIKFYFIEGATVHDAA